MTFESELESLRPKIKLFCAKHAGYEHADDLTQETFIKAWTARGKYRSDCPMFNWLCQIAVRVYIDWLRHQKSRPCVSVDDVEMESGHPYDFVVDPADEIEEWIEGQSADIQKRAALSKLLNSQSSIMALFCEGLSYEQISVRVGVPIGTVRSRMSRARECLRMQRGRPA